MRAIRFLVALSLVIEMCPSARADGIPAYRDQQGWRMLPEDWQYAVVSLKDDREILLLRIAVDHRATPEEAQRLVWVTPVPAAPSKVRVDILRGFPRFQGIQPTGKLGADLRTLLVIMAATQIYPVPLAFPFLFGHELDVVPGVRVFKRIRRDGVELELIGAESIQALTSHLASLEVEFPEAGLQKLANYTGLRHCLVVFRIADFKSYRKAVGQGDPTLGLGVEIDFPAEAGFFPLVASSALPGDHLSVLLTVIGYFQATKPLPPGLVTEYYVGQLKGPAGVKKALGAGESSDLRYTRFRLDGPPAELTCDLRFEPGAPPGVWLATGFLAAGSIVRILVGLSIFILLSVMAVLLASPAWPRNARPEFKALFLLSLANLATVIGLIFAARSLARRVGSPPRRATFFALLVSLVFVLLLAGVGLFSYRL